VVDFESVFVLSQSFFIKGLSCCIELVLLYRSRVIPGVLPRTSLSHFVFVFLLSFESVSALEPVMPTDLNETAVIFTLLCLLLPCASCASKLE